MKDIISGSWIPSFKPISEDPFSALTMIICGFSKEKDEKLFMVHGVSPQLYNSLSLPRHLIKSRYRKHQNYYSHCNKMFRRFSNIILRNKIWQVIISLSRTKPYKISMRFSYHQFPSSRDQSSLLVDFFCTEEMSTSSPMAFSSY